MRDRGKLGCYEYSNWCGWEERLQGLCASNMERVELEMSKQVTHSFALKEGRDVLWQLRVNGEWGD